MRIAVDVGLTLGRFDLAVRFGSDADTIGLAGPSGSGKSTLLNLIAGTLRPDRGSIRIGGSTFVDVGRRFWVPAFRRRIGYVFQDARLFPHLTVEQNLRYGRFFAGRQAAPPVPDIVDILGIGHLLRRRAVGLSGGEQQRVAIGRAFMASPQLLLMDEPLASLDAERRSEILALIERVRRAAAIPLIYVSHAEAEIARLADEVLVMRSGQLAGGGPPGSSQGASARVQGRPDPNEGISRGSVRP